ncbi:hypothetical protein ACFVFQ_00870 [Streptomyces sp. NPDC057743]|uniref:hypothetical protein n=1 Tax=Streptomyces sp. NPDC057743 TaxID=3346236 RepID=UPI0036833179
MNDMPAPRLRHRPGTRAEGGGPARTPPNQRAAPRRWSPELTAALVVIAGGAAVLTVLRLAPPQVQPALCGALVAVVVVALVLFRALWQWRHAPTHEVHHPPLPTTGPGGWFDATALEGFPLQELRPLLAAPGAPDLEQLHTAWILLEHGRDPAWVGHHLGLPPAVLQVLTDAAQRCDA